MRLSVAIASVLALLHAPVAALASQSTPTGSVSGIVTSADSSHAPLRHATVSLVAPDYRVPLTAITGDDGRFSFDRVPPGHYTVVASKPAYVGAFYGSSRPGRGPGVPVAVAAGGRVANLGLSLVRGGVIEGALLLPSGQPALNMPIIVIGVDTANGVRRLRLAGGRTTTDDRGRYRIFGLPPGHYVVRAQPSGLLTGALTGNNDARQTTASEISWAQEVARRSSAVAPATSDRPPDRGPTMNYAAVYFPGTTDPSGAAIVELAAGEERGGVDFALALVATAKISGTVIATDGRPIANVPVSIADEHDGFDAAGLIAPRAAVRTGADGTFAIPAVPPGRYRVSARATDAPSSGGGGASADVWAQQPIVVDGRDTEIVLQMQPGIAVPGRVVFDSATGAQPSDDVLARARIAFTPVSDGADAAIGGATSTTSPVETTGSFTARGLSPGRYRVSIMMPGLRLNPAVRGGADGWSVLDITAGAGDITDRGIDIRAGDRPAELVVRLTDRPTVFRGRLVDAANRAAPGYPIVMFSARREDWSSGSRRTVIVPPSTDGTFLLTGLPPGGYLVAAVVSVDPADLDDPAYLDQLAAAAVTVTLRQGATVVQDLRIDRR